MTTQQKQYALITGATRGIGYELAKLFAADQYNLVIVARDQQKLDKTASELEQSGIDVLTITQAGTVEKQQQPVNEQ